MEIYTRHNILLRNEVVETCSRRGHRLGKFKREYVRINKDDFYEVKRNKCILCGAPVTIDPSQKKKIFGAAYEFNCKKGAQESEIFIKDTFHNAVEKHKNKIKINLVGIKKRFDV